MQKTISYLSREIIRANELLNTCVMVSTGLNISSYLNAFISCHYQKTLFRQLSALLSTSRTSFIGSFYWKDGCGCSRSHVALTPELRYYWKRQRCRWWLNKGHLLSWDVSMESTPVSQCQTKRARERAHLNRLNSKCTVEWECWWMG